jgi:epsilon-lactone hydrolase
MNRPIDQLKAMLAARAGQGDAPATIAQMREAMLQFTSMLQMPAGVTVTETELGGVRGLRHTPDMAAPGAVLLYFHGGGYVQGSPQTHRSLVGHLARLSGVEAASMDYRLAPEAPFPAAVEDGLASYQALLDSGIAPARIIVGGDSAGGGLALASMVKARDTGLPGPAGLVLLSPWSDLTHGGWSHRSLGARDPMVRTENLERLAGLYLDGARADDPLASPLMADLEGLAPMLIQVGSDEVLLSDATQLAERAGAARVEVILEVWPEMIHVFQIFQDMLDEARAANARIGQWMRDKLGL